MLKKLLVFLGLVKKVPCQCSMKYNGVIGLPSKKR